MKQTIRSRYDYTKLVDAKKKEDQYANFSNFIDEKIQETRETFYDGVVHDFNRSTLAKIIGIDSSTLTKIINGSQATRKRDIIIAICFALHLKEDEANQALELYPMAPLNRNNLRDLVIIQALGDNVPLADLNSVLTEHGLPALNILRDKRKKEELSFYYPYCSSKFDEISVSILPYCVAGADVECDLQNRYSPEQFDYHSELIVQAKDRPDIRYRISQDDEGQYEIAQQGDDGWKILFSNDPLTQKYAGTKPCNDSELLKEVAKLKGYIDQRARYVHNMCNDTRNYGSRLNAENLNGRLVVYGEGFRFDAPEFCEYYQMEISNEGCLFTISNTSVFLRRYLGEKRWCQIYGPSSSQITRSFTTLEEVTDEHWHEQFYALLEAARDLLTEIRERKLFICNARAWIDIDELMHVFHVEEAFECYQPEDQPYALVPKKEWILGSDEMPIYIEDLYRAAELGIFSLEELCDIRIRYGSLEHFIQIDMLTEQKGK